MLTCNLTQLKCQKKNLLFRDRCVNGAIDNLIKKLPEDIKEDDEGEELKPKEEKDEKAEDFHFEGINIEDIDEDE